MESLRENSRYKVLIPIVFGETGMWDIQTDVAAIGFFWRSFRGELMGSGWVSAIGKDGYSHLRIQRWDHAISETSLAAT